MKLGVLTGGGDCPGLNAVIRAVVKTAACHGIEVIGFKDGFRGVVLNEHLKLTPDSVVGILVKGGTILGSTNRDNPFRFRVERDGVTTYEDCSKKAVANIKAHGLDGLIIIGGDGTLSCARDFMDKGIPIIGIPKTIDNDLEATDLTFGFTTAVDTATDAIEKLHTTAESHHRVMILEVMGRYAGWIALHSGIAGGADAVLIPEIPFELEHVAAKIMERKAMGRNFSIIVVAEGAQPKDGERVIGRVVEGSPDPIRLGGISHRVALDLETMTGMETRVTILGHLQRGGRPGSFDRILASRYGVAAVNLALAGRYGMMVSLHGDTVGAVTIDQALQRLGTVPLEHDLIHTARCLGISLGDHGLGN